jgi:hypothetical protein
MLRRRHGEDTAVWALRLLTDPLFAGESDVLIWEHTGCDTRFLAGARKWLTEYDPNNVDAARLLEDYCLPGDVREVIRTALLTYELELNGHGVVSGEPMEPPRKRRKVQ